VASAALHSDRWRALCNLCKRHLAVTHERSGLPAKLAAARQLVGARRAHTATLAARFAVATAARRAGDAPSVGRERALVGTSRAAEAMRAGLRQRTAAETRSSTYKGGQRRGTAQSDRKAKGRAGAGKDRLTESGVL
jgi:hypothetical protein